MTQRTADMFSDFERISSRMEQAWRQMLGTPGSPRFCPPLMEPPVDVYETEVEVVVVAEIAGVAEGDLAITVEERTLTVSGERRPGQGRPGRLYSQMEICHGPFRRELVLPAEVDAEEASAQYSQGMLEVVLPKVPPRRARPARIVVR